MKFLHVTGLNAMIDDNSFRGKNPLKIIQCLSEISEITARKYIKQCKSKDAVAVEAAPAAESAPAAEGESAPAASVADSSSNEPMSEVEYERVIISEEVPNIHRAHYYNFHNTYKLWKENYPCNILYTGPDVIFFKDIAFNDKFTKFSMFNFNNYLRKSLGDFQNYLGCDLRYFPSTMDEETWKVGLEMSERWPQDPQEAWEYEGIIYNKMLWSQKNIQLSDIYFPNFLFSYRLNPISDNDPENECLIENSHSCTIHSSGIEHIPTKLTKLSELGLLDPELVTKIRTVFSEFE
jgi:hypothetical protein